MEKVLVIGSGGAGKSTFSKALGEATGLPVVHLDRLYWRPGWTKTPDDAWSEIVKHELAKSAWIMDGNFGGTREMRMRAADTIILLDLPRWLCMWRILKRSLKYYGQNRPDMAEGCNEKLDSEFILWVWNYRTRSRTRTMAELERVSEKNIVILKTAKEVAAFLAKRVNEDQTRQL